MPITFECECGTKITVADALAGKQTKCPKCAEQVPVPAPAPAPSDAPAEKPTEKPAETSPEAPTERAEAKDAVEAKAEEAKAEPAAGKAEAKADDEKKPAPAADEKADEKKADENAEPAAPKTIPAATKASGGFRRLSAIKKGATKIVRFKCQKCQNSLSVPLTNAGKSGKCPHCGEKVMAPKVKLIATKGMVKTKSGRLVKVTTGTQTASGRVKTQSGRIVTPSGRMKTASGRMVTPSGRVITASGRVMKAGVRPSSRLLPPGTKIAEAKTPSLREQFGVLKLKCDSCGMTQSMPRRNAGRFHECVSCGKPVDVPTT